MKRIIILGLSVVAVLAFGSIGASSALAGEYGGCSKTKKEGKPAHYTGSYSNSACIELNETGEGEYEWHPVETGAEIKSTGKTGVTELIGAAGIVKCAVSKSKGFITGPDIGEQEIEFKRCEALGAPAQSGGGKKGVIKTFLLHSVLVGSGTPWCYFDPELYQAGLEGEDLPEEAEEFATVCSEPEEGEVWECLAGASASHQGPIPGATMMGLGEPDLLAEFETSAGDVRVSGGFCGVVETADTGAKTQEVKSIGNTEGLGEITGEHPGVAGQNSLWVEYKRPGEEWEPGGFAAQESDADVKDKKVTVKAEKPSIMSGVKIQAKNYMGEKQYCTAGPIGISTAAATKGKIYLLTAGHCIKSYGGLNEIWMADGKVIGPAQKEELSTKGDYGEILIASSGEQFPGRNPTKSSEMVSGQWQMDDPKDPVRALMFDWKDSSARPVKGEGTNTPGEGNAHEGVKTLYQKGKVVAQGRKIKQFSLGGDAIEGLIEDLAKSEGGDSGGPYFTEKNGGVYMEGTHITKIGAESLDLKATLTAAQKTLVLEDSGDTEFVEKYVEKESYIEVTGDGIGNQTTVTVKNADKGELEMSANAGAVGAQPQTVVFHLAEMTYYEPLKQRAGGGAPKGSLEAFELELLTTENEKRTS